MMELLDGMVLLPSVFVIVPQLAFCWRMRMQNAKSERAWIRNTIHSKRMALSFWVLSMWNLNQKKTNEFIQSQTKQPKWPKQWDSTSKVLDFFSFFIDRCLSNSRACYGVFETIRIKPLCKSYFSDGTLKSPVFFYMKFFNHQ